MRRKENLIEERRKYIRLDSVFPVQFRLLSLDGKSFLSAWIQGFTNNIGKGGLCLVVNNMDEELARALNDKQAKLSLNIEVPLAGKPVHALSRVIWTRDISGETNKYLIGLSYDEIDSNQNKKIMRYAWVKRLFVPVVFTVIIMLVLGLGLNSFINLKLTRGNKALVTQLVKIIQESSIAKQKVKELSREREDLQIKIQALQLRIQAVEEEKANLAEKAKSEAVDKSQKIQEMNNLIGELTQEKNSLQDRHIAIQRTENNVVEDLLRLDQMKQTIEKANLDNMYKWLKVHQNPHTGLVMSFEGDKDIENWAFTYDQALALQAYANFSDFERARKILDFFQNKAERKEGKFLNAYYVSDGNPAEYVVHSGPNIWLGIAAAQYSYKTKDMEYIGLAEDIAKEMIKLQNQDADEGIRGGPNIAWYSTEHNLDAYAFFNMLYKITGKDEYHRARDGVLKWIVAHTYDKGDVPVRRGKGDSAIATDTYAWSIAAIGPTKLEEVGMNPDRIIEFAEQNCSVEVDYKRPDGRVVKIKGFDFAPQRHVARGGVVSSEWTAQMVLSLRILEDFYYNKGLVAKARTYKLKAETYLAELGNMVISSASPSGQGESCLPYATQDYVDTGHGWMTPKGSSTGSVSGTVYTIFAYYKYNPLELEE